MRKMVWALLFMGASGAWAASETTSAPSESTTSTKVGNVLAPKKFEDDKRITDLELKAQSGSLSRYSLKFDLGYAGPPLDHLNDANKPNPDNRPGDNRTALSGGMALRYKTSSDTALNFGTGLRWYTPYQAVAGEDRDRAELRPEMF